MYQWIWGLPEETKINNNHPRPGAGLLFSKWAFGQLVLLFPPFSLANPPSKPAIGR
jgi:hypothetical protein